MKNIVTAGKFQKDLVKLAKRGKNKQKMTDIVTLLRENKTLPLSNKPHKLKGNYAPKWECHIEPDWLLIYDFDDENVFLYRSGTHSDLFR